MSSYRYESQASTFLPTPPLSQEDADKIDNSLISKSFTQAFPPINNSPFSFQTNIPHFYSFYDQSSTSVNSHDKPIITNNCNDNNNPIVIDSDSQLSNDYWSCSVCTFVNTNPLSLCCEMCTSIRESDNMNTNTVNGDNSSIKYDNHYSNGNGNGNNFDNDELNRRKDDNNNNNNNNNGNETDYDLDDEEVLNSSPSQLTPYHYELVSVIRHVGRSAYNGHYTCDVKKKLPQLNHIKWYRCDDSSVYQIPKEEVLSQKSDPYILFYQRIRK